METATLRPGLLVAIKTSLVGNVSYATRDLEREHAVGAARIAEWATKRTVENAAEHEAAIKTRSSAQYLIRRICAKTDFGCLCPEERAAQLKEAIAEARTLVDAFNATSRITRLRFYVITGRVAPDDVEAVRAIRAELSSVIGEMEQGIVAMTPEAIREAAKKAAQLSEMLTERAKEQVEEVIVAARATATAIVKAVKAGEQAALVIDAAVVQKLAAGRTAFLDLEDVADIAPPTVPTVAVDLTEVAIAQPVVVPRAIDLGEVV